jgi:hypothetical protein
MAASTDSTPIPLPSASQENRKNLLLSGRYSDIMYDAFLVLTTHSVIVGPSFVEGIVLATYEILYSIKTHLEPTTGQG